MLRLHEKHNSSYVSYKDMFSIIEHVHDIENEIVQALSMKANGSVHIIDQGNLSGNHFGNCNITIHKMIKRNVKFFAAKLVKQWQLIRQRNEK